MEPTPETTEPNCEALPAPISEANKMRHKMYLVLFASIALTCALAAFAASAPKNTTYPATFTIEPGTSVAAIADTAEASGVVRSSFLLYTLLTLRYDPTAIYAGSYTLAEPGSVFSVAKVLGSGKINDESITLTIPEGMRVKDIAALVEASLPSISAHDYEAAASDLEGYLYPETYRIPKHFTALDVVNLERATYEERVRPLREQIAASGFSEYEVLTLASIIEREANDETSMKMVSGIFQNRLSIGMALQADASIEYTLDTPLGELEEGELAANLRELDSPYNTYLYSGLPPTPIANPGLTAIKAVLEPTPSEYFYYLTDSEGNFYYAKTLDEHNDNIAKYLQ